MKTFDHPEETPGSLLAAENRSKANSMSQAERVSHFKRGMQIIYGGKPPKRLEAKLNHSFIKTNKAV
jgi:hypothetical protein